MGMGLSATAVAAGSSPPIACINKVRPLDG